MKCNPESYSLSILKYRILYGMLILIFLPSGIISAGTLRNEWPSYFGTQGRPVNWARSVRGVGRNMTGKVLVKNSDGLVMVRQQIMSLLPEYDIIVPIGGIGSGRVAGEVGEFLNMIKNDEGENWKNLVKKQVEYISEIPESKDKIYWQLGNEINSGLFNQSLRTWKGESLSRKRNDPFIIPYYVENFLAPTIEAIEEVSLEIYGSPGKIPIIFGTIGNAGNQHAMKWLDEVLNYKIKGKFSKQLAGKKVYELIHIIGLHYVVSKTDSQWETSLDSIYGKWMGKGRIQSIWSTEELGGKFPRKGQGAVAALKIMARYTYWWSKKGINSREGRCYYYGWKRGKESTRADDGMKIIYKYFGSTNLEVSRSLLNHSNKLALESYQLESKNEKKIAIMLFPALKKIFKDGETFPLEPGLCETYDSEIHYFSPEGHKRIQAALSTTDGLCKIGIPETLTLDQESALVFLLEMR